MSLDFASQINRLAAALPTPKLDSVQLANVDAGRRFAQEFVEASRAGALPVDGLMFATMLLGLSGKHKDELIRGFLQDVQKALEGR